MTPSTTPRRWRNWGRTESCVPRRIASPGSIDDVVALVTNAAEQSLRVKPVGAGHSFSAIAVADDVQVNLSRMRGLVSVDAAAKQVRLRAGTRLYEIPALLAPHGLAMANLGDVDRQTISGAVSTGTHGTGSRFGGISTQVVGATLVTGTGEVVTVGADDPELAAVALGLGALGVLVEVTLQCVDAFHLRADERPAPAGETINEFLRNVATHDHYEFYWFPHTDHALTKTNTRVGVDAHPEGPSSIRRYIDDELLSNKLFGVLCGIGSRVPAVVPPIAGVAGRALSARTYTDTSTNVFISARDVRFREMEYALPLGAVPDALRELQAMIERRGFRVSFPVEVRAAAADDLMLSTASGRMSGYIAVHRYHRDDPTDAQAYFAAAEEIMVAHDGRPHWGKMHTRDAEYFSNAYPRFHEFLAVREQFDPNRVFANPYLRKVLGD